MIIDNDRLKEYVNEKFNSIKDTSDLNDMLTYLYNHGDSILYERIMNKLIDWDNTDIMFILLKNMKEMRIRFDKIL